MKSKNKSISRKNKSCFIIPMMLIYIFSLMPFIELKRVREAKKEEKKRLADEDAQRRIKLLEEQCSALQKQVANHKQEEEALLSEMEVTGQAFEDMQDQNSKLLQQLSEKDDANFKLMSERIKSNQVIVNLALFPKQILSDIIL